MTKALSFLNNIFPFLSLTSEEVCLPLFLEANPVIEMVCEYQILCPATFFPVKEMQSPILSFPSVSSFTFTEIFKINSVAVLPGWS